MTIGRELVEAAAGILETGLPPASVTAARQALADCVACMLAAAGHPIVRQVELACASGVPGSGGRPPLPFGAVGAHAALDQALIGGTQAHALDFDDNHFPAIVHASAVLFPALLAASGLFPVTEMRLLECFAAGLEAQDSLHAHWGPQHYESGWHATSTIGTISAAVACGCALSLTRAELLAAISIASSLAGGSRAQFGSSIKPVHAGFAAQKGLQAALLARAGLTGVADPFGGDIGISRLFSASGPRGRSPQQRYAAGILLPKLYPCCMSAHMGIDAVLALKAKLGDDAVRACRLTFRMPAFMVQNLPYSQPATPQEARFSMNHAAAIALAFGPPALAHFDHPFLDRSNIRELRGRVELVALTDLARTAARPWGENGVSLTATMPDGTSHREHVSAPAGAPERPLAPEQRIEKFSRCAQAAVAPEAAARLWRALEEYGSMHRPAAAVFRVLDEAVA